MLSCYLHPYNAWTEQAASANDAMVDPLCYQGQGHVRLPVAGRVTGS